MNQVDNTVYYAASVPLTQLEVRYQRSNSLLLLISHNNTVRNMVISILSFTSYLICHRDERKNNKFRTLCIRYFPWILMSPEDMSFCQKIPGNNILMQVPPQLLQLQQLPNGNIHITLPMGRPITRPGLPQFKYGGVVLMIDQNTSFTRD